MSDEVWILGGTGRSGRAIAAELIRRGIAPVLVGRDAGRLAAAAGPGSGRTVVAGSIEAAAAEIRRQRPAVVINTVGPFTGTAMPIVDACLPGSHYLDLANDLAAVSAVLGRDASAAAAGRTLVTGAGFGVTATESVVVKLCEGRPAPIRVRVDMVPSLAIEAGVLGEALAATILDGLPGIEGGGRYDSRRYEGGRLVKARVGGDVTRLTLPDGTTVTTAGVPFGELMAAQRASGAASVISASSEAPSSPVMRAVLPAGDGAAGVRAGAGLRQAPARRGHDEGEPPAARALVGPRPAGMGGRDGARGLAAGRRRADVHRRGAGRGHPPPAGRRGKARRAHPGGPVRLHPRGSLRRRIPGLMRARYTPASDH